MAGTLPRRKVERGPSGGSPSPARYDVDGACVAARRPRRRRGCRTRLVGADEPGRARRSPLSAGRRSWRTNARSGERRTWPMSRRYCALIRRTGG